MNSNKIVVKGGFQASVEVALVSNQVTEVIKSTSQTWHDDRPAPVLEVTLENWGAAAKVDGEEVKSPSGVRAVVVARRHLGNREWTSHEVLVRDPNSGTWSQIHKGDRLFKALIAMAEAGPGFHGLYEAMVIAEAMEEPDGLDRLRKEAIEALSGAALTELVRVREALGVTRR